MMKSLRLFFVMLLAMITGAASADESSLTFTQTCGGAGTSGDGVEWTVTSDGDESVFDSNKGIHYGTGKLAVQYIKLSTSGITGTITKIVVNASTANGVTATVDVTVGGVAFGGDAQTLTNSAAEYTFEGSATGEIVVNVAKPESAVKALYVKSIVVTYTPSGEPVVETVAKPVFTPKGGDFEESVGVTLTCATEGATIYYAVSADAPQWQVYTEPITLTETTTLVAYAEKEGMENSAEASATFTKVEPVQIQQITVAAALEIISGLEDGSVTTDSYQVKGFVVGTPDFQRRNDKSLYGNVNLNIADEKGGETTLTVYRAKDYDNESFTEETISRLKENDEVVFQGKLQKYIKNEVATPELVNGWLVSVTSAEEPVVETVADPVFTPDGGEFEESIEVTLTCATEGATIMYAFAAETALNWQEYKAAITLTETTTVYAKAVKGDVESNVVSATFTKKEIEQPVGDEVTFNFNASDHAVSTNSSHDGDITENLVLTEGGVTMTVTPAESGTPNRFWGTNNGPQLRMYSGTMTLVAPAEKAIVKIVVNGRWHTGNTFYGVVVAANEWTGNSTDVVIAVASNTQMNKVVVTLADKNENTTTAISEVRQSEANQAVYTLGGQRVAQPTRGLYIMGGKKVLVK